MLPVRPPGVTILPALTEQNLAIANGDIPPPPPPTHPFLLPKDATVGPPKDSTPPIRYHFYVSQNDIDGVIEEARKKAEREKEEAERKAAEEAKKAREEEERRKRKIAMKEKAKARKHMSAEEKEALKEKRLQKLVGSVVVKCMSKYAKQMDRDAFKKHAKEV